MIETTEVSIENKCKQVRLAFKDAVDALPYRNPALTYGTNDAVLTIAAMREVDRFLHKNEFLSDDTQMTHIRVGIRDVVELWMYYYFPQLEEIPKNEVRGDLESFFRLNLGVPSWRAFPSSLREQIWQTVGGPRTKIMLHLINKDLAQLVDGRDESIAKVFSTGTQVEDQRLLPIFQEVLNQLQEGRAERGWTLSAEA